MTNYLLLRDNKQSGPYTFEEIRTKGLKAYDLVWIEGKSAAWRYPCEIEELSAFAPAVEEQPFDRFYKKPSQNQSAVSRPSATPVNPAREVVAATIVNGDPSTVPGKRIIYVTLPAVRANIVNKEHEKYLPGQPEPVVTPAMVEENYAQDHEDRNRDVEITPRVHRRRGSARIGRSIAIVLCVLVLLVAGIFIGMSLNKDALGFAKGFSFMKETPPARPVDHPSPALAVSRPTPPPVQPPAVNTANTDTLKVKASVVADQDQPVAAPAIHAPSRKEKAGGSSKSQAATSFSSTVNKDSAVLTIPAVRREASHRTDVAAEKIDRDIVRNNLANLVSLGSNTYTVGTFGGISDLQLTVSNHSVYPLDLVVVEIQYIQANKKVYKTETLNFRGIPAGSALMQEAPRSSRGIKVAYKITQVSSKEPGLSYSAL